MRAENDALRAQIEDLHGDTNDDVYVTAIQQDLDRLENLPRLHWLQEHVRTYCSVMKTLVLNCIEFVVISIFCNGISKNVQ